MLLPTLFEKSCEPEENYTWHVPAISQPKVATHGLAKRANFNVVVRRRSSRSCKMKTRTVGAAILLPALCLTCLTAVAGTLFDDFGPGNSYQADCAWAVSGPASPIGQFIQANEFTAVASETVTTINLAISLTELPGHGSGSIWTIGNAGLPGIQLGPSWDFTTSLAQVRHD